MTGARSLLLASALALASCASAPPASPTATPALLPSPTPTIVFPTLVPTPTVTPLASPTTSPELAAGPVLFRATFASDEGWLLSSDADGGASLSGESLVIAVSRLGASRYVLVPIPPVGDFLLESTIRAGLCGAEDEVGVLFRVGPQAEHYRFTLSCSGVARMVRVLKSGAAILAGPAEASSAIPGSPAMNHLAVLGRGQQFTFFINGVEVLQERDSQLVSGGFGFFVRSSSQGQTTAALTALTVRALQPDLTTTLTPASG